MAGRKAEKIVIIIKGYSQLEKVKEINSKSLYFDKHLKTIIGLH
jgi:hypothetical protein